MFPFGNRSRRNDISSTDLQQHLSQGKKYHIVDVREPWEFEEGHIPGCTLRPLGQIHAWSRELNKEDEIVLVCRSGSRSAGAYEFLERQGFKNLSNLGGGMISWRGPVERTPATVK